MASAPRVLHINTSDGGVGRYGVSLARGLSGLQGVEVRHVLHEGLQPLAAGLTAVFRPWRKPSWPRDVLAIVRLAKAFKPDIIHDTTGLSNSKGLVLWPILSRIAPLVITDHDPEPHSGMQSRRVQRMRGIARRVAAARIVHGPSGKAALERQGVPSARIFVVPVGVEPAHLEASAHGPAPVRVPGRVLYFGEARPNKGFHLLPDIVRKARALDPRLSFVVRGNPAIGRELAATSWPATYARVCQELQAMPGVTLGMTFVPDDEVPNLFLESDICLLPYLDATQSAVAHAAMPLGAVLLATNVGDLAFGHGPDETAVFVEPNVDAIVAGLVRLMRDAGLRERVRSGARAKAAAQAWPEVAKTTGTVYQQVLGRRPHPPHVMLVGTYSPHNFGDAALTRAAVQAIQCRWPGATVDILTPYVAETEDHLARDPMAGVRVLPARLDNRADRSRTLRYLSAARAILRAGRTSKPIAGRAQYDLCLAVGGGYLFSSRKGPFGMGILSALIHLWAARREGIPTATLPVSLGPFRFKADERLTARVLRTLPRVLVREEVSLAWAKSNGIKAALVPDLALGLRWSTPPPDPNRIGVTVMDWSFAAPGNSKESQARYEAEMVSMIRHVLVALPKAVVTVYPHVIAGDFDDDGPASRRVVEQVASPRVVLREFARTALLGDVVKEYCRNRVLVCSRLHSALLALSGGAQVVVLGYQPKSAGTMDLIGLGEWVVPIGSFEASRLSDMVVALAQGTAVQHATVPNVYAMAMDLLSPLVEEASPSGR